MPENSKGRKWRGWCSSALTQTVRGAPLLVWNSGKADGNGVHSHRVTLVAAAADPISLLFFFLVCNGQGGRGDPCN
jgi:hypothetical protein